MIPDPNASVNLNTSLYVFEVYLLSFLGSLEKKQGLLPFNYTVLI